MTIRFAVGGDNQFFFDSYFDSTRVEDERGHRLAQEPTRNGRNAGHCCRMFLGAIFSQLGLLVILVGYLFMGGYLFRYLELENEYNVCLKVSQLYRDKMNDTLTRVVSIGYSGQEQARTRDQMNNVLVTLAEDLYSIDFNPKKNCSLIMTTTFGANWNIVNSIYFCATIVTTIGYGQIAPTTFWGRVTCMFYAVIGVPLMLIYLASIGDLLARIFRFVYVNICCCRCCNDVIKSRRIKRRALLRQLKADLEQHKRSKALALGKAVNSIKLVPEVMDDLSDTEEEKALDNFNPNGEISIPVVVIIGILSSYVLFGSYLFQFWEPWTINDGAYFSFITISTIGFGDLVPGMGRMDQPQTMTELIIGALYCVFGLSLLSMCFNLVQNELVNKFNWLGKKLGFETRSDQEMDYAHSFKSTGFAKKLDSHV